MKLMPLALAGTLLWASAQAQKPETGPLTEDERIAHVLSRLTFGPRPGDAEKVRSAGIESWLNTQLGAESADNPVAASLLKEFETLGLRPGEISELAEGKEGAGKPKRTLDEVRQLSGRELRASVVVRGVLADHQLREVLMHFWRNHFNVHLPKESVLYTATHYEEHALRPHALGKFQNLLSATAHHPAMLVYLDNALSRRPPSKSELKQVERKYRKQTGSRETARELVEIAKQSGLNENYARELLELHTLGVDNGYTQKDVIEVARAFTGWTVDFEKNPDGFRFRGDMHDPGPKVVLGKALPEGKQDEAIAEGEAILKRLAQHDSTAEFIATKLVRYLVNDDPPAAVVAAAAKTFRSSKGDLRETVRAIVLHPEFFARAHFRAKFKTPLELVFSAVRVVGAEVETWRSLVEAIDTLGMPIYGCEDPTGFSDAAEGWRDPGVMAHRWRFAMNLVSGKVPGVFLPSSWYEGLPEDPLELSQTLVRRICPSGVGSATAAVLERVVLQEVQSGTQEEGRGRKQLARKLTGILLGSPEFQQQ